MDLARTYASLGDEQLKDIYRDRLNLTAEAAQALDKELRLRELDVSAVAAKPKVVDKPKATPEEAARGISLGIRIGVIIFIIVFGLIALGRM